MEEDINFIGGTFVNSETSPVSYKTMKAYHEKVQALNDIGEADLMTVIQHFNTAIQEIHKAMAEIETSVRFDLRDIRE